MAAQTELEELQAAWGALCSAPADTGWSSIGLSAGPRFRAGAAWPGASETLLVGFVGVAAPGRAELPQGRGFAVRPARAIGQGYDLWIALERQTGGANDLFGRMAADVIESLAAERGRGEAWLLTLMLARIRAWQDFMSRPRTGVLSPEAELGLTGELIVLEALLDHGVPADAVVDAWQGPDGGLQDFQTGVHGLEVKTSLAAGSFPARISSLEQLDEAGGRVLLLAAVRLCVQADGRRLPDVVTELRSRLAAVPGVAAGLFDMRMLQAGYFDAVAAEYVRPFARVDVRVYSVDGDFPRLARSGVRPEIRAAEYDLDLDLVTAPSRPLAEAIRHYGVW